MLLEAAQRRLDENPQAMHQRRETVEHPFGTLKMHGRDAFPDEAAAKRRHRDGTARAVLQPHARDEHRRREAALGGDLGLRGRPFTQNDIWPLHEWLQTPQ